MVPRGSTRGQLKWLSLGRGGPCQYARSQITGSISAPFLRGLGKPDGGGLHGLASKGVPSPKVWIQKPKWTDSWRALGLRRGPHDWGPSCGGWGWGVGCRHTTQATRVCVRSQGWRWLPGSKHSGQHWAGLPGTGLSCLGLEHWVWGI